MKERAFLSLLYSVNADVISFIHNKIYIKIIFFQFYVLNQDFFLTITSMTL